MVTNVEEFIGRDLTLQGCRRSREGASALIGRDQLRLCLDDGLLHGYVSLCTGSLIREPSSPTVRRGRSSAAGQGPRGYSPAYKGGLAAPARYCQNAPSAPHHRRSFE